MTLFRSLWWHDSPIKRLLNLEKREGSKGGKGLTGGEDLERPTKFAACSAFFIFKFLARKTFARRSLSFKSSLNSEAISVFFSRVPTFHCEQSGVMYFQLD
jgi:hypothetical protein